MTSGSHIATLRNAHNGGGQNRKTGRKGARERETELDREREDKGRGAARGKEGVLVHDGERARSEPRDCGEKERG